MKKETKFYIAIGSMVSVIALVYLTVFLCKSFLPDVGIRNEGFDPAELTLLDETNFKDNVLTKNWSIENDPSISNGSIKFDKLSQAILSPKNNDKLYKYIEIDVSEISVYGKMLDSTSESSLAINFYSNDDKLLESGYFPTIKEIKSYYYQSSFDNRNISYIKIFLKNYPLIDQKSASISLSSIKIYNVR